MLHIHLVKGKKNNPYAHEGGISDNQLVNIKLKRLLDSIYSNHYYFLK
jgi:hypothetical protein